MAKSPPETVENFTITLRGVPKANVGDVHAAVAKLDLDIEIDTQLVVHVATFAKRGSHETKSSDFLMAWIVDHPTFRANEAVKAFEADGRNGVSAYGAFKTLIERKILKKVGDGEYAHADQKALPAPKKAKKAEKAKPSPDRREVNHREFVLKLARRNHGRFNTSWMKKQFDKDRRSPTNVSPTIAVLLKLKQIKRVSDGEYVLLAKQAEAKTNGNGAAHETPAAEVTHG